MISAEVPISFISIRLHFWNLETPTIRQFVFIFSYVHTWYQETKPYGKIETSLHDVYLRAKWIELTNSVTQFSWQRFRFQFLKVGEPPNNIGKFSFWRVF